MRPIIITIILLFVAVLARAQTVTTVQWWFDNDNSQAVTESTNGRNYVWRKEMSTATLQPGFHRLNVRFKDNAGYWSGATSHYFLKLDGVHGNVISHFEYWYGTDMDHRRSVPLGTVDFSAGSASVILLNLPMDTVANGLHQLNYRVGYVGGVYSAVSTTFFYKCDNVISEGNAVFEYWIDDNFGARQRQTFANLGGMSTLHLDLSALAEEGLHRLNYRIGNQGEAFGNVSTDWFFSNRQGANVLEWTFDDNPTVHSRTLSGSQENVIFDLPTTGLPNGVHSVHFRAGHNGGNYTTPLTTWFVKGANPYVPVQSEGQKVAGYVYWFDNEAQAAVTDSLATPVTYYAMDKNLITDSLARGIHTVSMRFRDNWGQLGEIVTDTFKVLQGNIAKAKIKNLEPNVNPYTYRIKRLATVYRYYRIFDEANNPVEGAVVFYIVGNKEFHTNPSNADGYVTIEFKTWGNDVNTNSDDDVTEGIGTNNRMFFTGLYTDVNKTKQIEVTDNDFGFANLIVSDYQADEEEYALELEGEFKGNIPVTPWAERLVSVSDKAKLSLIFKYADDWNGKRQLSEHKYAFQNKFSASSGGKLKTPTPVFSASASLENGAINKYKMEADFSSHFRTAYDLLCGYLEYSGNTDTKLFAIVKAIGNYLDDPPEIEEDRSKGVFTSGKVSEKLDLSMGGIPDEVSPIKIKLEAKQGVKGTYEFGNTSTRVGILGNPHTYSDYLKNDIKKNFDVSGNIDFGDFAAIDGLKFGVDIESSEAGGMKIERKMDANYKPTEGSITMTQSSEYDVSAEFTTAALPWLPAFHVKTGKEYSSKYTLKKDILDNQMYFPINDPLWNYFNHKTSSVSLGNADEIMPNIANISNGLSSSNPLFYNIVNNNFSLKTTKKYTSAIGVSKKIGLTASFIGLDWSFEASAYALLDAKYPLGEFLYHPTTDKMYPQVKYADIDKPYYWFSPTQMLDDLWENCWDAIKRRSIQIATKVLDYLEDAVIWVTGSDEVLTNSNVERQYARSLKNYSRLQAATQNKKSVLAFHIPSNEQAFDNDTEVKLEWFYPGGELMGKTENQDTMVVISDLFFLRAVHKWDTLSVAPHGNFKIYATVGDDDLAFLEIDDAYPVSVYHQSFEDETNTWHLIGSVNDTIEYDKMGMYCLGIGVNSDNEPPVITISKEEKTVQISITDNMAVYWKNVYVIINGLTSQYQRNGNTLVATLTEEQSSNDIHVTVHASDLARNESSRTAIISAASSDATLKSLTVSAGTLSPAFHSATTVYTVTVPNDVTSIDVTGTANHTAATVSGNVTGKPLDVGDNVVNIVVTAEDGIIAMTYTVTVTRLPVVTGVEETLQADISAYPNPFKGEVRLTGAEGCMLTVFTTTGKAVHTQKVTGADETIHLEHLPAGLYLFRLEKNGKTKTLKIMNNE